MQQQGVGALASPSEISPIRVAAADPRTSAASSALLMQEGINDGGRAAQMGDPSSVAEVASPISILPPAGVGFEGGGRDDDPRVGGEEDGDRGDGTAAGYRWPRQETLALLKVRSEMDAVFRDATLKGPLWEDVSRKLAVLGYRRSAKKCKEKFENVRKYYKRTKEGRAGRQDGKSYKFFTELEALHSSSAAAPPPSLLSPAAPADDVPVVSPSLDQHAMPRRFSISPAPSSQQHASFFPEADKSGPLGGISFSSESTPSTSMGSEEPEDGEFDMEAVDNAGGDRKRKRRGNGGGGSRRMMEVFEGVMKHVMRRQEEMQRKFLEAVEKRERDRMIREEAWKRQEMSRQAREQELLAQERAMSAARDAAIISFIQKITGQKIQLPAAAATASPPPAPVQQPPPPDPPQAELVNKRPESPTELATAASELHAPHQEQEGNAGAASSRWPKAEVLALINLRSGLDSRYQEANPKGPLWEEISAGMQRMGYGRSAKRCKEKWENINKYFKKVKESNKKRPEDAKTCPYYHQLEELYRNKMIAGSSVGRSFSNGAFGGVGVGGNIVGNRIGQEQRQDGVAVDHLKLQERSSDHRAAPFQPSPAAPRMDLENKDGGVSDFHTSDGGQCDHGGSKKAEDVVMEKLQQGKQAIDIGMEGPESDSLGEQEDGDVDDDDQENGDEMEMAYKIQFQR